MGIFEEQQQRLYKLEKAFEDFKSYVLDYFEDIDDEIKGYERAARFIGVSISTLERLVRQKRIPYKKDGKAVSFSRKELFEYKRRRRIGKSK
ncbi:excisionase family DNA binding protein [Pontibacter ummariensis]|uniref:DNA binding domain-containing protein, excisionase family n=1 Tax=Pontibacter ummariensis TaxID=1610492 RepID=A0A239IZD2_9BACT|nr:helix-turn-helix domain-containing protein [Pontibacter ummariensis]PRY09023.1 excisionase family DNA binding protein [Pontibacter ummariensis]SNS98558.1 DNA binding domain-containing protein, excisionase family [Pontibacter ummariensis]